MLDQYIYKVRGHNVSKYKENSVGIEIELEGSLPQSIDSSLSTPYWNVKPEGSLRGGYEYVFRKPLLPQDSQEALSRLIKTLNDYSPKCTIRTSTHIHVNVDPYTQRQVYQILGVYYLLEKLLIRTQPKSRWGNLFCRDMEDAEGIQAGLIRSIREGSYFHNSFNKRDYKYGAVNLAAPQVFGSLEFRFLQAYYDPKSLTMWSDIFLRITHWGKNNTIEETLTAYDSMPVKSFIRAVLGDACSAYVLSHQANGDISDTYLNELLHTNYDNVAEIGRFLSNTKFQMPAALWNPDTSPDEGGPQPVFNTAIWEMEINPSGFADEYPDDEFPVPDEEPDDLIW